MLTLTVPSWNPIIYCQSASCPPPPFFFLNLIRRQQIELTSKSLQTFQSTHCIRDSRYTSVTVCDELARRLFVTREIIEPLLDDGQVRSVPSSLRDLASRNPVSNSTLNVRRRSYAIIRIISKIQIYQSRLLILYYFYRHTSSSVGGIRSTLDQSRSRLHKISSLFWYIVMKIIMD